jgi:hypothetical protein
MQRIRRLFKVYVKKDNTVPPNRCYSDSVLYIKQKPPGLQSFSTRENEFKEAMRNKAIRYEFELYCDKLFANNYFDLYEDLLFFSTTEDEEQRKAIFWKIYEKYLHLKAVKPVQLRVDQIRVNDILRECFGSEKDVLFQDDLSFLEHSAVEHLVNLFAKFKSTKDYSDIPEDVRCTSPLAVEEILRKAQRRLLPVSDC